MAKQIVHLSDNMISFNGPVNTSAGATVSETPTSVKCYIYDEHKETRTCEFVTRLSTFSSVSDVGITVPKFDPQPFEVGDTVVLTQDDGSLHTTTVASIGTGDPKFDTITVNNGTAVAAAAGSKFVLKTKVLGMTKMVVPVGVKLEVGDAVEILQDDLSDHPTTVSQVQKIVALEDAGSGTATTALNQDTFMCVTLGGATTDAVTANSRMRRPVGSVIDLIKFGTFPTSNPIPGDSSWGFRAVIPDTHPDLVVGMTVRIEVRFNGGAELMLIKSAICGVVEDVL